MSENETTVDDEIGDPDETGLRSGKGTALFSRIFL